MSHLLETAESTKIAADALRAEYLRLLELGADDGVLAALLERLHVAALAWADAQERAGLITEVEVVAGERVAYDRAGHVHHIGAVDGPPVLGARAEGCYLVLPEALGALDGN